MEDIVIAKEHNDLVVENSYLQARLEAAQFKLDNMRDTLNAVRAQRDALKANAHLGALIRKMPQGYWLYHMSACDKWCLLSYSTDGPNTNTPEETLSALLEVPNA